MLFVPETTAGTSDRSIALNVQQLRVTDSRQLPCIMATLMRAADRALAISEVLEVIFSFCHRSDAARCALVCRRWKDLALDCVWRELESLFHLFQILSPLKLRGEYGSDEEPWEDESDNSEFDELCSYVWSLDESFDFF